MDFLEDQGVNEYRTLLLVAAPRFEATVLRSWDSWIWGYSCYSTLHGLLPFVVIYHEEFHTNE